MNNHCARRGRCQGFSLVEVLIAALVFAIGLLSTAWLQVVAKQSNSGAVQRTTATLLAYDMVERMRANPASLSLYKTPEQGLGGAYGAGELSEFGDCATVSCTAELLAAYDLWEWEQALDGAQETVTELEGDRLTGGLVSPTGCVVWTGPEPGAYTVAVAWRGLTEMIDESPVACGKNSGKYGDVDEFRRVLAVETYINNE